jgi:hypothetical protein
MESADFITESARERASKVSSEELQREILAQLYIQNHFQTKQTKQMLELTAIKGHLVFQTVMYIIALFGAIAVLGV